MVRSALTLLAVLFTLSLPPVLPLLCPLSTVIRRPTAVLAGVLVLSTGRPTALALVLAAVLGPLIGGTWTLLAAARTGRAPALGEAALSCWLPAESATALDEPPGLALVFPAVGRLVDASARPAPGAPLLASGIVAARGLGVVALRSLERVLGALALGLFPASLLAAVDRAGIGTTRASTAPFDVPTTATRPLLASAGRLLSPGGSLRHAGVCRLVSASLLVAPAPAARLALPSRLRLAPASTSREFLGAALPSTAIAATAVCPHCACRVPFPPSVTGCHRSPRQGVADSAGKP